ncbi:hypothetical protein CDG77_23290 [Nostoc sp. 'Peltigera membranacea cyanobiont' 213]|nr:hypothetical protein CDG77_23290 [Nostoc sp. 'Peltigera membranacea cyanobiont' 213]
MGSEAGEDLAAIIRRKEWERQLGGGYFFWGIGQSLGENARIATREKTSLHAFFSPMLSKPKTIDVAPTEVVLWNAWIDVQGRVRQLPIHCLVTSRASLPSGRKKESHYALVCFSDKKLNEHKEEMCISPSCLRNMNTNKPLGSSQVTAVVRVEKEHDQICNTNKSYSVSFTTELRSPYCIQLVQPMLLDTKKVFEIKEISYSGDIESWIVLVKQLRSSVVNKVDWVQCTLDLGEAHQVNEQISFADSLNSLVYPEFSNVKLM